jgi:NADH-quinone oxidoreductase subunit I
MSTKVKIIERKGDSLAEKLYLIEVFKGMATTFGHFIRNFLDNSKLYIRHYPEVQPEIPKCISIDAGERIDGRTEKMPVKFEIDLLECIYCGYCVEACPMDAIRMDTGIFSVTGNDRSQFVMTLSDLLATKGAFTEEEYKKGGA